MNDGYLQLTVRPKHGDQKSHRLVDRWFFGSQMRMYKIMTDRKFPAERLRKIAPNGGVMIFQIEEIEISATARQGNMYKWRPQKFWNIDMLF